MFQFEGVATGGNREKYTTKEYLTYGGVTFLVIGMFVLYAFEFEYFRRYTDISSFIITALISGLLSGIGIAYYLRDKAKNALESVQIYIFCIVLCLIFAPLIFSLTNRLVAINKYEKEVQVVKMDKRFTSRYGTVKGEKAKPNLLKITYLDKGENHEFSTKYLTLENAKRRDYVKLNFKKGLLGFEYISPN
ncbi:MAG: hypothetical protein ACI85O_001667 [Saprospiraceae bacterium]|jgi:hypothetical protein